MEAKSALRWSNRARYLGAAFLAVASSFTPASRSARAVVVAVTWPAAPGGGALGPGRIESSGSAPFAAMGGAPGGGPSRSRYIGKPWTITHSEPKPTIRLTNEPVVRPGRVML